MIPGFSAPVLIDPRSTVSSSFLSLSDSFTTLGGFLTSSFDSSTGFGGLGFSYLGFSGFGLSMTGLSSFGFLGFSSFGFGAGFGFLFSSLEFSSSFLSSFGFAVTGLIFFLSVWTQAFLWSWGIASYFYKTILINPW